MAVTRKQFEKAMKDLPKLRAAEATIKEWNDRLKALGGAAELMDVSEINDDGSYTVKPKEVSSGVAKTG